MTYTKEQAEYITAHGGDIDKTGHIRITYKSFRKIGKDYANRDLFDKRHVWLIPGSVLLIEGVHFTLVKNM